MTELLLGGMTEKKKKYLRSIWSWRNEDDRGIKKSPVLTEPGTPRFSSEGGGILKARTSYSRSYTRK